MPKETNKTDFDKASFKKYSGKYLQSGKKGNGEQYLHRAVWKKAHGNIPKGYEVHHKDHNTLNNSLSNLTLIKKGQHQSMHNKLEAAKKPTKKKAIKKVTKKKAKPFKVKPSKVRRSKSKPKKATKSSAKKKR